MRLIDADAYEKSLHVFYGDDGLQEINPDEVFIKLHEAQTVDAVPVVRCKDCKFSTHSWNGWDCINPNDRTRGGEDGDWFCADGERREDDGGRES